MNVVLFTEPGDDLSLQALTLARQLGDVHAVSIEGPYAPAAWAAALAAQSADAFVAAGSDRGNELLAHVAATLGQPFAANVTAVDGDVVARVRWGGSLLEEARLHGSPLIFTVAPHTQPAADPVSAQTLTPELGEHPRVIETVSDSGGGVSLREAKVVVRERPDKPGSYHCVIHLRPHFQLDQMFMSMRLTTDLAPSLSV